MQDGFIGKIQQTVNSKYGKDLMVIHGATIQWRTEGGGGWDVQTPLPKFQSFDKAEPNSRWKIHP
jgi:hypothetical protein